jgi:hypothetical protein
VIRFTQSILHTDLKNPGPETMGDCTRACIASILHVDPSELPNPHGEGFAGWGSEWRKALAGFGLQPVWVGQETEDSKSSAMDAWWDIEFPGYWLATVKIEADKGVEGADEDGFLYHCVVMLFDQLAHDPYPNSITGEYTPEELRSKIIHATFFLPIDPSRAVTR